MAMPPEESKPGVPEWIVTYGDLMSLLLTFFVLLAAFSEIKSDEQKSALVEQILRQFGDPEVVRMFTTSQQFNRRIKQLGSTIDPQNPETGIEERARVGAEGPPGKKSRVETLRDGERRIIGGPALFEPGSAALTEEARSAIMQLAAEFRGKRSFFDVRGVTPVVEIPPTSPFADPLDLAYARTAAVARSLADDGGIPKSLLRLSVAAPIEVRTLPRMQSGEPMKESVMILPVESVNREFDRATVPPSVN